MYVALLSNRCVNAVRSSNLCDVVTLKMVGVGNLSEIKNEILEFRYKKH